jgi:hypothetical protein
MRSEVLNRLPYMMSLPALPHVEMRRHSTCKAGFSERKGTPSFVRCSAEDKDLEVIGTLANRNGVRAPARRVGVPPTRWSAISADSASMTDHLRPLGPVSVGRQFPPARQWAAERRRSARLWCSARRSDDTDARKDPTRNPPGWLMSDSQGRE